MAICEHFYVLYLKTTKKKKNSKGAKIAMMADAKTPLTTTAIDKRNNAQGRIYEDIIGLHSKYIVVN